MWTIVPPSIIPLAGAITDIEYEGENVNTKLLLTMVPSTFRLMVALPIS
jgi:hypothetical protein